MAAAGGYRPIVPQGGLWPSAVLGLELGLERNRLRFFADTAPLPDASELIHRLSSMVDDAVDRAERLAAKLRKLGIDPDAAD